MSRGVDDIDRVYSQIEADVVIVAHNYHIHPVTCDPVKGETLNIDESLASDLKSRPGT